MMEQGIKTPGMGPRMNQDYNPRSGYNTKRFLSEGSKAMGIFAACFAGVLIAVTQGINLFSSRNEERNNNNYKNNRRK